MSVRLEMSLSLEEFLRLLPGAVGQAPADEGEGRFSGGEGGRRWSLRLLRLPDRRLGSVILPRHRIELRFKSHSAEEIEAFMARFHRGFMRGGG